MLHTSAAEHFEKLKKVLKRIDEAVHKDDLDDFFKTAYHLIEIIEKDAATTPIQKTGATALRLDVDFRICREIANSSKHFGLDARRNPAPVFKNASTLEGFGVGRYGMSAYGVGEQSISIHLSDGTSIDAQGLVRRIFEKWSAVIN
jgi:hypothetical protein